MRVAVTGGSGFIGAELVRRCLERGDSVRVLTRGRRAFQAGVQPYLADLTAPDPELRGFLDGVDVLYHCAGELADQSLMDALHVGGTRKLIQCAGGRIRHWVQLSSVGAYGSRRVGVVSEDTAEAPKGAYEVSKTRADALVSEASQRGAFSCAILRPSTVFGTSMPNQSLGQWIAAISRGWFFFVGKPGAIANYVHVASVVDALLLCGSSTATTGRVFIASEAVSVERFVQIVCDELGCSPPRFRLPEAVALTASLAGEAVFDRFPLKRSRVDALTARVRYDASRLRDELKWQPSVGLEDGLREFVASWGRVDG